MAKTAQLNSDLLSLRKVDDDDDVDVINCPKNTMTTALAE